jgi:hypothetical protein
MSLPAEKECSPEHPEAGVENGDAIPELGWFKKNGFSNREIAVLSRIVVDGLSVRQAAKSLRLKTTTAYDLFAAAKAKLAALGIGLPTPKRGRRPNLYMMPSRVIDAVFQDPHRYNHVEPEEGDDDGWRTAAEEADEKRNKSSGNGSAPSTK